MTVLLFSPQLGAHVLCQPLHGGGGAGLDLLRGQGLFRRTDGQTQGHGLLALRHLLAPVLVHKGYAVEQLVALFQNSVPHSIPPGLAVHQHRHVVVRHGVLRQVGEGVGA